jgi:hypothetical protein
VVVVAIWKMWPFAFLMLMAGLQSVPHPMGLGEFIESDAFGLTAVAGVWVAGNVADLSAGVIGAAAAGMVAATAVNADLIAEDTRRAVAVYRKSTHEVPVDAL